MAQPRRRKHPSRGESEPHRSTLASGSSTHAEQPLDEDGDLTMGAVETVSSGGGMDFVVEGRLGEREQPHGGDDPWSSIFRTTSKPTGSHVAKRPSRQRDVSRCSDQRASANENDEEEEGEEEVDDPTLPPEYQASHRGKPCGHVFQVGEGVYWCRECAMDQTCVLCYRCFHATGHEGHETSFSVSQKAGGCCDCGDPEAWRRELKCHFHSPAANSTAEGGTSMADVGESVESVEFVPVPEDLKRSLRSTLATTLDFIIDTLSASPIDFSIPTTVDSVLHSNPPETPEEKSIAASAAENGGGIPHVCLLWNDELHSFMEIINRISSATRCTTAAAKVMADQVDLVGREVVYVSTSIPRLITIAKSIASAGLAVTIRTSRETLREIVAGHLVVWMRDLLKRLHGERRRKVGGGRTLVFESVVLVVRRILCEELASPRRRVREVFVGRRDDVDRFTDGSGRSQRRLRIDCLLAFDARLWKSLRAALRELYISTMIVSGEQFKRMLGVRFAMNYLLTANSYLILDREWEISIINFSVQLFTVATIANHLVQKTELLETIFSILKTLFLTEAFPAQFQLGRFFSSFRLAHAVSLPHYYKLNCEGALVYEKPRYMHLFYDVRYLLTTHKVANELFRKGGRKAFVKFLDLCCVLQGMNPQKRELRDHVAFESKGWINCFNLSLNIGRAIEYVGEAFAPTIKSRCEDDFAHFKNAFMTALKAVDDWCTYEHMSECAFLEEILAAMAASSATGNAANPPPRPRAPPDGFRVSEYRAGLKFRVMEYRVLMRPVSLHNPLFWMLSMLLSFVPYYFEEMAMRGSGEGLSLWSLFEFDGGVGEVGREEEGESRGWVPVEATWGSNGTITVQTTMNASMVTDEDGEGETSFDDYGGCLLIPDVDAERSGDGGGGGRPGSFESSLPRPRSVPEDFRVLSREDRVSRLMDYILRVDVLLAQIRAGIWVRNGQIMRDQAMYFKHLSLRDIYDHGLLILQSGATLLGPDRFLTTVLERFELSLWFSGRIADAVKHSHLEPSTLECLAEEMLYLLIQILTERGRPSGMSMDDQIRRELIHLLALHPQGLPHSKLAENIPERMTRAAASSRLSPPGTITDDAYGPAAGCRSLDEILPTVATFRFPDGTGDTGMYVLRDEMFEEVDAWYWHYTPTCRAGMDGILNKRTERRLGGKMGERGGVEALVVFACDEAGVREPIVPALSAWETFAAEHPDEDALAKRLGVRRPRILKLSPLKGFEGLDHVVDGAVFCQMLFFCLHNVNFRVSKVPGGGGGVNDKIMNAAIHMLLVAAEIEIRRRCGADGESLSDGLSSFLTNVGSAKIEFHETGGVVHPFSLVDLVLHLLHRCSTEDAFREYTDHLAYFLILVVRHGGVVARKAVTTWAMKMRMSLASQHALHPDGGREEAEKAKAEAALKKKLEAKERQKAIMRQFETQQKSFMKKYQDDEDFIQENMEVDDGGLETLPGSFPGGREVKQEEEGEDGGTAGVDGGVKKEEEEEEEEKEEVKGTIWTPPSGNCIVCQEELDPTAPRSQYGMLGLIQTCFINRSRRLDLSNPHSVASALSVGSSLDVDMNRPFSSDLASTTPSTVSPSRRFSSTSPIPPPHPQIPRLPPPLPRTTEPGTLFISTCSHLMHFTCYDLYKASVERRQVSQEYRSHPENLDRYEFLCPLCKTLGNCIVPVFGGGRREVENRWGREEGGDGLVEWWPRRGKGIVGDIVEHLDKAGKVPSLAFEGVTASTLSSGDVAPMSDATRAVPDHPQPTTGVLSRFISVLTADLLNRGRTVGEVGARAAADRESMRIAMAAANAGASTVAASGRRDDQVQGIILRLIPTLHSLRRGGGGKDRGGGGGGGGGEDGPRWLDFLTMLSQMVSATVSGIERGLRGVGWKGVGRPQGVDVLEQVGGTSLTLLRVLSEAILHFGSVIGDGWMSTDVVLSMFRGLLDDEGGGGEVSVKEFFLGKDPFGVFVDLSFLNGSKESWEKVDDVFFMIRLLWHAEVVRTVLALCENLAVDPLGPLRSAGVRVAVFGEVKVEGEDLMAGVVGGGGGGRGRSPPEYTVEQLEGLMEFLRWILTNSGMSPAEITTCLEGLDAAVFMSMVESITLPFLRKCVIHLHGRYSVVPVSATDDDDDDDEDAIMETPTESEKLCRYLRLPVATVVCSPATCSNPITSDLIKGWLSEVSSLLRSSLTGVQSSADDGGEEIVVHDPVGFDVVTVGRPLIRLETPAVFELIGLPKQLEVLFEECFRKTCVRCGGDVGVFLLVKTFRILFLNHEKGTYMDPPYLDSYGEVDLNLRKGRLQFLHQRRYDEVRKIWLGHGIPSHVARGIDSIGSLGLWTTF
ncbi:hypothetical protein HDU67_005962 [Dinochytrium kinnereticum]|nr:hypothetical protein HDU67_005962 [Dinochytrium kinnereticum]